MSDGERYTTITHRDRQFQVRLIPDTDHGAPWDEHDGHGAVSKWTTRPKAPGERVLVSDRQSKRYYDFQGTIPIALRDQWGAPIEGETPDQQAARAVEADFQFLKDWCEDRWRYVGVVVDLLDEDGHTTGYSSSGLWGVEDNSGREYLIEVAREQADELLAELPAELDKAAARIARLRRLQVSTDAGERPQEDDR